MNWQTKIEIPASDWKIGYDDRILLLGSCFSDEMASRLTARGFSITANPMGTMYNPCSVSACLEHHEIQLIQHDGLWHSMLHHGSFSSPDYDRTMTNCIASLHRAATAFAEATVVVVTFGTAWVYEQDGQIVANCHKLPASCFTRRRLTVEEVVRLWQPIVLAHPEKHFLFTVSPIRHRQDGYHANQLSKGILLEAEDRLVSALPNASYFPSYEILLDELRDYRFYADDMLHPSKQAADYIFERFTETYMTKETCNRMNQLHAIWLRQQHRPLH